MKKNQKIDFFLYLQFCIIITCITKFIQASTSKSPKKGLSKMEKMKHIIKNISLVNKKGLTTGRFSQANKAHITNTIGPINSTKINQINAIQEQPLQEEIVTTANKSSSTPTIEKIDGINSQDSTEMQKLIPYLSENTVNIIHSLTFK